MLRGLRHWVALGHGLCLLACSAQGEGSAGTDAVRWLGRVEDSERGVRFAWPGSGFEARFTGTTATAWIATGRNPDYFQVVVDGTNSSLLKTAPGTYNYTLTPRLAPGDHHVLLWRRTESFAGTIEVRAVGFGIGAPLEPPPAPERRIEIVGDSISAGYGIECTTSAASSGYLTENHYRTYGAVAARELHADLHTLAWSGIGMLRDHDGDIEEQMPVRYQRTIATEAHSRWDFSTYTPQAVVVLLGTNDFAEGDPGIAFADAYVDFVRSVRERYLDARIYVAQSPMLTGDDRVSLQAYLEQVLAARASEGDQNLAIIDFRKPTQQEGWGCDRHPNAATHATMAALLVQTLRGDLGW